MNKWIKQGVTGFVLGAAVVAMATETKAKTQNVSSESSYVSVDAIDLAGGSKLKDRPITDVSDVQNVEMVRALIDA